jgi:pSer/pThr/pTyr-binding forkhead associated (FHA) protein
VQPQGVGQRTGAAPAPTARTGSPGYLYVVKGDRQGQSIPLHHGFRIGKAPSCDLVLAADNFASTFHAHIQVDKGGNATLVDDNSTNGTFVNGVRATAPKRLMHGMLIRCGQTELRFMQG